jgi:hypothetical protein
MKLFILVQEIVIWRIGQCHPLIAGVLACRGWLINNEGLLGSDQELKVTTSTPLKKEEVHQPSKCKSDVAQLPFHFSGSTAPCWMV